MRITRLWLRLIVCLAMLVFGSGAAIGDEEPVFAVYRLSVPDYLQHHWVEDLDNDGLEDIVAVHRKGLIPNETRWISIFWQGRDGSFSTAPDQSWEVDSSAVLVDVGDVTGDERKEICFITPDAVRYHALDERRYREVSGTLFGTHGMAVFPSKRNVPLIDFVRDWNGDGKDDVTVFTFDGLEVHTTGDGGADAVPRTVHIDLETDVWRSRIRNHDGQIAGLGVSYTFPDVTLEDFDGNGRDDLIVTTDDRASVYLCGEDGVFSEKADADFFFDVLTQQERIEEMAEVKTTVVELDNDGYADAVVAKQTHKGLTDFRGVVNVYRGGPGGYGDTPDQVIISEGTASAGTRFWDVNGDGRKDLVLPSVKLSITAIIRILITRSIRVSFNIYLMGEDGRFSDRPDFTKDVKYKIDMSGESDDQATDLEGDYNGDGRTDFVFATKEDQLSIYLGIVDDDELFSDDEVAKVEVDAYGEIASHDLNGNGYSDMVIYYPMNKERKGTMTVLVNLGRLGKD